MHKKTFLVIPVILMGASFLAALFLVLNSTCVEADLSPAPYAEGGAEKTHRTTATRGVTIVRPGAGAILTMTHQPTYTVDIDVADIAVLDVISVSVDDGATYHEAEGYLASYSYDWGLPDEDYEEHLVVARAAYSAGQPRVVSDTATIHVDTRPPQGAVITVPAQVETTGFDVFWSATDGSEVIVYTVQYRRDDQLSWTSCVSDSGETSKVFTEDLDGGHSYTFRMRARDKGGNASDWVQGTVQVGRSYVYLPLTLRGWVWWYKYDVYEPNDTPSQAWGPLEADTVYEAYIWNEADKDDYYHFTPLTLADVEITLTNIPEGSDYDLYVYYYDTGDDAYVPVGASNNSGTSGESVTFRPVPFRRYYARVYPYAGFSREQPYHLMLTYSAGS